jgi:hypothetical protein
MPEMARTIHHTNNKGKRGRKPQSKLTEPDFYNPDAKLPSTACSQEEEEDELSGPGLGLEESTGQDGAIGAFSELGRDQQVIASAFATQASAEALPKPSSSYAPQLSENEAPINESIFVDGLQSFGIPSQAFLSPVTQQYGTSQQFEAQLPGYLQQQQQQQQQSPETSFMDQQHFSVAGCGNEQVPSRSAAPQPSYSMGSGFGLFGQGGSSSDEVSTSPESVWASHSSQPALAYEEHQHRINDLISLNQQQQRRLQLQQQQLEQQRLELHLRQEQAQDLAGRRVVGQVALPGPSFQPQMPMESSNFQLEGQQQLQHYQHGFNNLSLGQDRQQQQPDDQGHGDSQSYLFPFHDPF